MKVLMLSSSASVLDSTSEDALRLKRYAQLVEELNILVVRKLRDILPIIRQMNIANFRYNLITAQDPFLAGIAGYLLKKKTNTPLIIDLHGDFLNPQINWLKIDWRIWLFKPISKFLIKKADGIRTVSSAVADSVIKLGVDKEKITVAPVAVDLNKFLQLPTNNTSWHNRRLLFVGSLEKIKNVPLLLQAAAQVNSQLKNKVKVVIAGSGSQQRKIQRLSYLLNVPTEFLGKIKQTRLAEEYAKSFVVILPSLSESFGRVLIEANAAGKPVIATDTAGAREIIKDGYNGYIFPQNNISSLADKILKLLNDPDLAQQMGKNGRKLVKNKYSPQHLISQLIQFWQKTAAVK